MTRVPECASCLLLQDPDMVIHLGDDFGRKRPTLMVVSAARLCGDDKAGWHGKAVLGHLGKTGTLAPEELSVATIRLVICVYIFGRFHLTLLRHPSGG